MFISHICFQSHTFIRAVKGRSIDRISAHTLNESLVVAADNIGSLLLCVRLVKAVSRKNNISGRVVSFFFCLPEMSFQLRITHLNILRLGINRPIQRHTVHLSFLVADDGNLVLKGHIFFNISLHKRLHCFQCILNLNELRIPARFNKNNGNLFRCFDFFKGVLVNIQSEGASVFPTHMNLSGVVNELNRSFKTIGHLTFTSHFSEYNLRTLRVHFSDFF